MFLHLRWIKLDWLLGEDSFCHASPVVLPCSLAQTWLDIRILYLALRNHFINNLITIEWHVPFGKTLVAVATLSLLIEHLLQVEIEITLQHFRGCILMIFIKLQVDVWFVSIFYCFWRRAISRLELLRRLEWQLLMFELWNVNLLVLFYDLSRSRKVVIATIVE